MSDAPFSLFDEVLDLFTRWSTIADEYERHAAVLLRDSSAWGRGTAHAHLEFSTDLMKHHAQLAAMRPLLRDLEGVLLIAQERAVSTGL